MNQSQSEEILKGKRAVVTGASSGIGTEITRGLASLGAEVIMACRNAEKAEGVRKNLLAADANFKLRVEILDLASLDSIRAFAARLEAEGLPLDILVNNAGAWTPTKEASRDGIELTWAGNVLGPELLTELLLPLLKKAGKGRIVNVASTAAGGLDLEDPEFLKRPFSGVSAYSQAKQANRMLSWALAARLEGSGVTVNAMSPGFVRTELNRDAQGFLRIVFSLMGPLMGKTPAQGADTAIWLASSPEIQGMNGKFWEKRKEVLCKFKQDTEALKRLEGICLQRVGLRVV